MRSMSVVLCDNDFSSTVRPLLETIYKAYTYHEGMTKEHLELAALEGLRFHYIAFQLGRFSSDYRFEQKNLLHIEEYLKKSVKIMFDDEADEHCLTADCNSGAWHLLFDTGTITTY